MIRRSFIRLILQLSLLIGGAAGLWGAETMNHRADPLVVNVSPGSEWVSILLSLSEGESASWVVTDFVADAALHAPSGQAIQSCSDGIPGLRTGYYGEVLCGYLDYWSNSEFYIENLEKGKTYTLFALNENQEGELSLRYTYFSTLTGEMQDGYPKVVRATSDSLVLQLKFDGEANYRWLMREINEQYGQSGLLPRDSIAALRTGFFTQDLLGFAKNGGTVTAGDTALKVVADSLYTLTIHHSRNSQWSPLTPLSHYAFWGATFSTAPNANDRTNAYVDPIEFYTFIDHTLKVDSTSVSLTIGRIDQKRTLYLVGETAPNDDLDFDPTRVFSVLESLPERQKDSVVCLAGASCTARLTGLGKGRFFELSATFSDGEAEVGENIPPLKGFWSSQIHTLGRWVTSAELSYENFGQSEEEWYPLFLLEGINAADDFHFRIQFKGGKKPAANLTSFSSPDNQYFLYTSMDGNSLSSTSEGNGEMQWYDPYEPGREYEGFVAAAAPNGKWEGVVYSAGTVKTPGEPIPHLVSMPQVISGTEWKLRFDAPGRIYWKRIPPLESIGDKLFSSMIREAPDGVADFPNTGEVTIDLGTLDRDGSLIAITTESIEGVYPNLAQAYPLPYSSDIFAIDFYNEQTVGSLPSGWGWTDKKENTGSLQPIEAGELPLIPGTHYYLYDLKTLDEVWDFAVPARPKAPKIELEKGDLQIVKLLQELSWRRDAIIRQEIALLKAGYLLSSDRERDAEWYEEEMESYKQRLKEEGESYGEWSHYNVLLLTEENRVATARYPASEKSFASASDSVVFNPSLPLFQPSVRTAGIATRWTPLRNFTADTLPLSHLAFQLTPAVATEERPLYACLTPDSETYSDEGSQDLVFGPPALDSLEKCPLEKILMLEDPDLYRARSILEIPVSEYLDQKGEMKRYYEPIAVFDTTFRMGDWRRENLRGGAESSDWAMVGLGTETTDPEARFGEQHEFYRWFDDASWRGPIARYRVPDSLAPGEGVWVDVADSLRYERELKGPYQPVRISLTEGDLGWNQIANPYPFPIALSQLGTGRTAYRWDREKYDYIAVSGALEPFGSVWITAEGKESLTLQPTVYFSPSDGEVNGAPAPLPQARLKLSAGQYTDQNHTIGIGDIASLSELPAAMGPGVSLTSLRDDRGWRNDWREAGEEVYRWRLALTSRLSGVAEGVLELEESFTSAGWKLWVKQKGELVPLSSGSSLRLSLPRSGTELELYAARDSRSLQKELAVQQGWNVRALRSPDGKAISFRFDLSESTDLKLRVVDATGRSVMQSEQSFGAGSQVWEWTPASPLPDALFWSIRGGEYRADGVVPVR